MDTAPARPAGGSRLSLEHMLPRLASAYHRGLLVPFLGAGMSAEACPTWEGLVEALEQSAGEPASIGDEATSSAELIRRSNSAIRTLARRGPDALRRAVHDALYPDTLDIPPATSALARLWWPLVISTNYDDLFVRAYRGDPRTALAGPDDSYARPEHAGYALDVLGRSVQDCERVLQSLHETSTSILWALHGYLPADAPEDPRTEELVSELVLGHEAYQRITHASTHYRRAFAETFRQRSFLFLGTSLSDVYLLGQFAEVQELYGPSPYPHYALLRRGDVDPEFLRTRFNILVLEYDTHEELPGLLNRMSAAVLDDGLREDTWAFRVPIGAEHPGMASAGCPAGRLVITGSPLPGTGHHVDVGVQADTSTSAARSGHPDGDGVSVVHDLSEVAKLTSAALERAAEHGDAQVHVRLLAARGTQGVIPRFVLAEMIRGFASWCRTGSGPASLTIYARARSALFELASGHMDVVELLVSPDLVRFWIEVREPDEGHAREAAPERELVFCRTDDTLAYAAEIAGFDGVSWCAELDPPTTGRAHPFDATDAARTLAEIGVLPGATLRFWRGHP